MSLVNISNVSVLNNPSTFATPFAFEVTFECISALKEDLEFKLVYVGSAESEKYDQVLESVMVGPVPVGVNKFILQTEPPKTDLIPAEDLIGVTVILLTCSYRDQQFVRVGYYVNTDYQDEELRENPPNPIQFDKLVRNILAEKPRVTRIPIEWDTPNKENETPNGVEQTGEAMVEGAVMKAAEGVVMEGADAAMDMVQ